MVLPVFVSFSAGLRACFWLVEQKKKEKVERGGRVWEGVFEEMTSEGERRETKDVETDRKREGGTNEESSHRGVGLRGSSVSFPGMQPWDCLQRKSRKTERSFL